MRIVESAQEHEGRLEIYMNGVWGTVCRDFFDDIDATVACQQRGFWYVCIDNVIWYTDITYKNKKEENHAGF